ncbi:hypothetical protein OAJ82_00090 [Alphaproteobacteria bacterium]|nr:hypothetical protein [Alphaproteobacteria bacterium]
MNRYFIIPTIIFFAIIALLVIYLQFFYVDWKWAIIVDDFDVKTEKYIKKEKPNICNDQAEVKIVKTFKNDFFKDRVFIDSDDTSILPSIHSVYLLPCDVIDRKFDINNNINYSIESINNWFLNKTDNQIINFDKNINDLIDTTFIRVNKTIEWFTKYNTFENSSADTSAKIESIILSNSDLFINFNMKKFIVFFEGWEKRVSITNQACGRSRHNGKVAIFFTNEKNKKRESCTSDNINQSSNESFGESEQTILHEILHTLGAPSVCGSNLGKDKSLHVTDSKGDIMNKVSGSLYLDYNNDDYYKHNIPNCPDLYKSKFLSHIKK